MEIVLFSYAMINRHEFEPTPGDSEGQGSLVCCTQWDHKEVRHNLATEKQQEQLLASTSSPSAGPASVRVGPAWPALSGIITLN